MLPVRLSKGVDLSAMKLQTAIFEVVEYQSFTHCMLADDCPETNVARMTISPYTTTEKNI